MSWERLTSVTAPIIARYSGENRNGPGDIIGNAQNSQSLTCCSCLWFEEAVWSEIRPSTHPHIEEAWENIKGHFCGDNQTVAGKLKIGKWRTSHPWSLLALIGYEQLYAVKTCPVQCTSLAWRPHFLPSQGFRALLTWYIWTVSSLNESQWGTNWSDQRQKVPDCFLTDTINTNNAMFCDQGAVSIRKTVLPGVAIPMLKIRRSNGRLIFNIGIAIPR